MYQHFLDVNSAQLRLWILVDVLCGHNFPKYERKRPSSCRNKSILVAVYFVGVTGNYKAHIETKVCS
jgi:hypothetical protein